MQNNKSIAKVIATIVLSLLMIGSAFLVFSNTKTTTVNAQTTTVSSNLLQYEWPFRGADTMLSYSSSGPAPSTYNVLWKTTIPGLTWPQPGPVAFNGMIFVQGTRTYALDPSTGNIIWNASGTGALVKLDNTYMMRGTTCIRISDGSTVWTPPAGFSFAYYAPDLKMFVSPKAGWNIPDPSQPPVLAWDITGQQYSGVPGSYALYANGKLFVGTQDCALMALDAKTGKTLWLAQATSAFLYSPIYVDGKVIFGGLDNNMHAWDANTGKLLWTYNPGTWYGQWASAASTANGLVFEHNQDTYLYAINATTGQMVWRVKGPGIGYSGLNVVGGGIVFSPMGEAQYRDFETGEFAVSEYNAYNATTGELIWSAPMETAAGPVPHECIAYGNLYIAPIFGTQTVSGSWAYGGTPTQEVWCIGSQVKDWPMMLGSADNSAEGAGPSGNLALKWKFKADGPIVSSTVLVNGVGYFGTHAGTIYAVDASTGALKWNYSIGFPIKSTPAVANGKIYTGPDDGNVYALDSSTGAKVWQTSVGGVKRSPNPALSTLNAMADSQSSPKIYQNTLYVGALDGNLYALDLNSGNILWKYQTGGPVVATPAITSEGIYVAACTPGNGTFYKLDLNGQLIWKNSIPYYNYPLYFDSYFVAAPTVATDLGIVFLRNSFRLNYGINATTGNIIWTYDGISNPDAATSGQFGGVMQVISPLYKYGRIYINDYYGITCLNASTGKVIWQTFLSREDLAQGFAYSFNRLYTVNEVGVVYVLDALTGSKISYYEVGTDQMHSAPSLYSGSLYVGCNDWNLRCFGDARIMSAAKAAPVQASATAAVLPQANLPAPAALMPAAQTPVTTTSSAASPITLYIAAAAVAVIIVIAAAALAFRRRK